MAKCSQYADISVSPGALSFEAVEGWKFLTPSQYIKLSKAGPGRDPHWTARTEPEAAWLHIYPMAGVIPGRIKVNCETRALSPGLYAGAIIPESIVDIDIPRIPVLLTVHPRGIQLPPEPGPPEDYEFPEPENIPPETEGNGETGHDPVKPSEGAGKGLWDHIIDIFWALLRALTFWRPQ